MFFHSLRESDILGTIAQNIDSQLNILIMDYSFVERLGDLSIEEMKKVRDALSQIIIDRENGAVDTQAPNNDWEIEKQAIDLFLSKRPGQKVIDITRIKGCSNAFIILSEMGEYQVTLSDGDVIFLQQVYQGN